MKPISTGTGLCALAGAVLLYPLLHRAAPQAGALNAASAESVSGATQSGLPKTPPPLMPTPPSLPPMGGGETVAMMSSTQCIGGAPLNWFTEVHLLPTCANLVWSGTYINSVRADVNNDGAIEDISLLRGGAANRLFHTRQRHSSRAECHGTLGVASAHMCCLPHQLHQTQLRPRSPFTL